MKWLIALAFSLPLYVSAQDCNLKKGKDAFNNKGKLSSGLLLSRTCLYQQMRMAMKLIFSS